MLPSPEQFDQGVHVPPLFLAHLSIASRFMGSNAVGLHAAMHDLGVGSNTHVVVYDCSDFGIFSAPRLWWTLRAFGHDNVSVLNGGLQQWKASQFPLETGPSTTPPKPSEVRCILLGSSYCIPYHPPPPPYSPLVKQAFTSKYRPELVRSLADMIANIEQQTAQVADARSTGRYVGHSERGIDIPTCTWRFPSQPHNSSNL
jgi:3-mercaptopyruvate sulfurtransferase SseA